MTEDRPLDIPDVLLSIRPGHARDILDGSKRYEYRRVPPTRGPPMRLILYTSRPVGAAIGEAIVDRIRSHAPEVLAAKTAYRTPQEVDDILSYFDGVDEGHGLSIASYRRFDDPVEHDSLVEAGLSPAQNFRYIDEIPPVLEERLSDLAYELGWKL